MKKNFTKIGTYILKSSIVTWILLLLIWTLAAKYNTPDFLPNPKVTWDGFLEVLKIPLEEAYQMALRGELPDAKTQIGVLRTYALVKNGEI